MNVRPSDKFLLLVKQVHGSVNAAAAKWDVNPTLLYRFISGEGGMTLETAAQIAHKSSVGLDELFVIEPDKLEKVSKR